jgi:hypothetical protein
VASGSVSISGPNNGGVTSRHVVCELVVDERGVVM